MSTFKQGLKGVFAAWHDVIIIAHREVPFCAEVCTASEQHSGLEGRAKACHPSSSTAPQRTSLA
jgi:hypothetical protein